MFCKLNHKLTPIFLGSLMLLLTACGGNGNGRSADSPEATAADTIAMFREVGSRYAQANRPDSATLAANIRRRPNKSHIESLNPTKLAKIGGDYGSCPP